MKLTVNLAAVLGVILVAQTQATQLTVSEKLPQLRQLRQLRQVRQVRQLRKFDPPSGKIKAVDGTQDYLILYWDTSATGRVRLNPNHTPAVYIEAGLQCTACSSPDSCVNFDFPRVHGQPTKYLCLEG